MDIKSPFLGLLSYGLFVLSTPVLASDLASVIGEFEERFSKEVPVSGNVVAGLMLVSSVTSSVKVFSPYIQLPGSSEKPEVVCLSVVSQDGVYSSHNSYRIPANSGSKIVQADYSQSMYHSLLSSSDLPVALKAQPGKCGQTQPNRYFIARNGQVDDSAELILKVDSLGATDVLVAAKGADRKVIRGQCKVLEGERKTGFDYSCRLPLDFKSVDGTTVKIQRLHFGRKMPAVSLEIDG